MTEIVLLIIISFQNRNIYQITEQIRTAQPLLKHERGPTTNATDQGTPLYYCYSDNCWARYHSTPSTSTRDQWKDICQALWKQKIEEPKSKTFRASPISSLIIVSWCEPVRARVSSRYCRGGDPPTPPILQRAFHLVLASSGRRRDQSAISKGLWGHQSNRPDQTVGTNPLGQPSINIVLPW